VASFLASKFFSNSLDRWHDQSRVKAGQAGCARYDVLLYRWKNRPKTKRRGTEMPTPLKKVGSVFWSNFIEECLYDKDSLYNKDQ